MDMIVLGLIIVQECVKVATGQLSKEWFTPKLE